MIVVEGPDGAGKTTLITGLQARWPMNLQARVVGTDTVALTDLVAWVEHHNRLQNWVPGAQPRLYDRHRLISEFIYGPVMGRPPEPGFDDLAWVSRELKLFYMQQPLIIYCLPPIEEVRHNVQFGETDNTAVQDRIDQLWVGYARLAANDCLYHDALLWDYTQGDSEWLMQQISEKVYARVNASRY